MSYSKGELMKKLGMIRGVDSALPLQFINMLVERNFNRDEVTSHFVMDY